MSRRWITEASVLAVSVIGAASIARLTLGHAAWRGALVTALAAGVAAAASIRFSTSWSIVAGAVVAAVSAVWVTVPGATWHGLPTATTVRTLDHALKAVGSVHVPMAAGTGVVLICSVLAGVTAVGTRVLPGTLCLVPAVVLVAVSTVALPSDGAAVLAVLWAAAATIVVVSRAPGRTGWGLGTVTTVAAALCVVLVGVVTGTGAAAGGGIVVDGVPPTALSLVSRLTALQIHDPDLVLFTAVTPVPTYWQVGSLSVLRGDSWVPDASTAAALRGGSVPAVTAGGPGGQTFTVTVTVAHLDSRLLPVPPSTTGVSTATLTSVGVVSAEPSRPGQRYRATASVPSVSPGTGTATSVAPATVASDTQLPTLPPVVVTLARTITASASTPLDKAEALTNWFRSRLFHYSLAPTRATLVSFLTTTHTGSCEQFAGAFAVLARAVGLPTRVAIGFTTGVRDAAGQTVVRGIDAHAWPEVLLGGRWTSFEPTPQEPSGELSPPGVIGLTAVGNPNPISATTLPHSFPKTPLPLPVVPVVTRPRVPGSRWWGLALGVALLAVAVAVTVVWRRRRRLTPDDRLMIAWRRVDRALRRHALARPPWRTPVAHTRALRAGGRGEEMGALMADLAWLAESVEEAAYGATPADTDVVRQARATSRRVVKALSSSSV
jgi:transglutaminase-like putative cysteine protease